MNCKFCQVSFRSGFSVVLPAAFGDCDISVKVLENISKQILIKALRTETSEKCAVPGSLPKITCFYGKHDCWCAPTAPWGTELSGGGRTLPLVLTDANPKFPFSMTHLKLLRFPPARPVPMASPNVSAGLSQPARKLYRRVHTAAARELPCIQGSRLLWH